MPNATTQAKLSLNPDLARLQPYPFEKLRALYQGVEPNPALKPINLSIGEPKHPTPQFIRDALTASMDGLAIYPPTLGSVALRESIASWIAQRYGIPAPDPATQILPVNGSREALFAITQVVIDRSRPGALVISPNPFYQIYEGAALLAGAETWFLNSGPGPAFAPAFASVPEAVWQRTQLLYTCSPANPCGRVMPLAEWQLLFELSDRYGFVIASDECYSEIHFDEARPPLGALQAARALGRDDYRRLIVFSSLSKRSNCPGMRSGFVAGDAQLIKPFLLYRTYHGSAMSLTVQAASTAAWRDEAHVRENRRLYAEKFHTLVPRVAGPLQVSMPEGGFYFWARTPGDDAQFARELLRQMNVASLPGSFLARESNGVNPGAGYLRLALVSSLAECSEAVDRIVSFLTTYDPKS